MISLVPRRDAVARARLALAASKIAPVTLAGTRVLAVPGQLGEQLPRGGVRRGSVMTISGSAGVGVTSAAIMLAAGATAAGEWAAFVGPIAEVLGGSALHEGGVALERVGVVRNVAPQHWSKVVGALLDGVSLVIAALPQRLALGDARRLSARARERRNVLVIVESVPGARTLAWPGEAAVRIRVDGVRWDGLEPGTGLLASRSLQIEIDGDGATTRTELAG